MRPNDLLIPLLASLGSFFAGSVIFAYPIYLLVLALTGSFNFGDLLSYLVTGSLTSVFYLFYVRS